MRTADERVKAINAELHKRPTTTGVRYRLQWEPLSLDEGAPAGLEQARQRLLNTSADLWSPEDRRTIGQMLQQQISAERARADADAVGGSLIDQLARALDYRHWHRFRIQRLRIKQGQRGRTRMPTPSANVKSGHRQDRGPVGRRAGCGNGRAGPRRCRGGRRTPTAR